MTSNAHEVGLNINEMESFKRKLRPPSNAFLSSIERDDEYLTYDNFFRALAQDLESRRGIFPDDFVRICRRIVYGPDGAFHDYDKATRGIVFDSVPSIVDKLLPKWFAQRVREIIMKDSYKKAIIM